MKRRFKFFIMTMIVGFMLAVQFHTNQEPVVRDTRDIWELRNDLERQKQIQQELYAEIYKYEQLIDEYSDSDKEGQLETLEQTLADLKKDAGLTEVSGQGIELTIEPLLNDKDLVGKSAFSIHPELLRRLINELNSYGAEEIAIDGERIINTTPIREVNGKTYINDKPISSIPIKVKVLTRNPGKLHTEMLTSQSGEDFARENLLLTSELVDEVSLPPYNQQLRVKFMKEKEDT
ncbi:DUF881 domain-containing protein [Alkalihalobacillus sp. TS-13]|uniref:DUF881 domain-containing protein n=1 Tax=Alkalihalobacillus sp. TS-13 TaxID=2842455 RepID=UPI001C87DB82|nr:DUF881 domain-containing protein [Alkalihalobacillus sp. TS-13]